MTNKPIQPMQFLLSLPPRMAAAFEELEERRRPAWFATSDPAGSKLGSGGGTAHLLAEAWHATAEGQDFDSWLRSSRKLIIHGGGQSRRLPAYAPEGKILMPMPVLRWARGQRLDQKLLDLQLPDYQRVLEQAPEGIVAMVASGDVVLRFGRKLPRFPEVDVLGLGMWVPAEKAKDFGVFFAPRHQPNDVAFFLQKPSPDRIRELAGDYLALVDTGMWLFSGRAVRVLMERCGWDAARQVFTRGQPEPYELYAQFGLGLGRRPQMKDAAVNALTCAVVPLPDSEFYHFGTSRQMIESMSELQNAELDAAKLGLVGARRLPSQHVINARFGVPLRLEENHSLWIENSVVPASWELVSGHVLTGIPDNRWDLHLEAGVCLDFAPVGEHDFCARAYGFQDSFSGTLDADKTTWFGRPIAEWFRARGLTLAQARFDASSDIQQAALFPVLSPAQLEPRYLEWLFAAQPASRTEFAQLWLNSRRLSAAQIQSEINLNRLYQNRAAHRDACILPMMRNARFSVFHKLDLASTARSLARTGQPLPERDTSLDLEPLQRVHDEMFRAAVLRERGEADWQAHEARSFAILRETIVREAQLSPALPQRSALPDQIVWGRSPVRFDLAGGWTDTPPYCLEQGGRVLNVAVDLNGQPPIQVFAKLCERPELVMRSIDLGVEQRLRTYEEIDTYAQPGSEFGLAKAAFALAGFLPRFHAQGGFATLEEQLRAFGGGIEVSMLCAVPKGSGLGTSSILAATLLATLGDLCGLNWNGNVLFSRTLAMEQMLTTGGGWQDQAGAIFRGIKLIETAPGLSQKPTLRWLPEHLFERDRANKSILLYYTGLTRLAKNILAEIVRGIFLNSPEHLRIIGEIGANADRASEAVQTCDAEELVACIRRSWQLNQELDAGTNPPEVQAILDRIADHLAATKLLGAGGGGYLLLFAKDDAAASRIRQVLTTDPPNDRARFVDFSLSGTGLQVTRS
ncbi:MAG: bifunctional fucokinase/L-fucose-1-P-guanylyltransferase [Verrucomicrobia bacterium]|nr:bifunctional fucokinase/L-fucose-1-P-guanylyltransferase [Verrucomicrobiota bacterium]